MLDVLSKYASARVGEARNTWNWNADPRSWHLRTAPESEVWAPCRKFGVDSSAGEGPLTHSLHTIVIGRAQKLAANFEWNEFTAEQLDDFVDTQLRHGK